MIAASLGGIRARGGYTFDPTGGPQSIPKLQTGKTVYLSRGDLVYRYHSYAMMRFDLVYFTVTWVGVFVSFASLGGEKRRALRK
ncbi:hypothetical protein KUV56_03320 [Ferrimonas balearica]|uniref:hypothetical protein n=1 Tax=Ferrimonas balearica TaxID=44012 RepID=UPI001C55BFF1|nr:hypothetical protein [Ferrimonas balearica]MBW3138560.1 hypothetical protein [Ferrimonas balearica]